MKSSKRIYLVVLVSVVLLVGTLLTSCKAASTGSKEATSTAAKTVSFTVFHHFTPQEARGKVLREIIEEYNRERNGKFKVETSFFADWQPLQQKIRTMVASGSPPDVFLFNYNPNDLSLFESGQLMDFSPYMDNKWKKRFNESDLEKLTFDGKLMAIPVEQGPVLFYYNMKLLKKAGINDIPRTWDQFFDMCEKLKATGITPVSMFTSDDAWHATNFFSYLAASIGGPEVFTGGFNSPAVVEAAELLKKLFGYTTPDAIGGKWAVSVQNFLTERTAVLVDGPWVVGMIEEQMKNPEEVIAESAPKMKENAPLILVTDTITPWAASKNLTEEQKKGVVDFLKYLTSEEIARKFAVEGKTIFAVKLNLTDEDKKIAGPKLTKNVELMSTAEAKVLQVTRIMKPAAMNELPRLLEALAMDKISAKEFVDELQRFNQ